MVGGDQLDLDEVLARVQLGEPLVQPVVHGDQGQRGQDHDGQDQGGRGAVVLWWVHDVQPRNLLLDLLGEAGDGDHSHDREGQPGKRTTA
jgi:hypothetical protein